jgi:hypothetical protein
MLSNTIKNVLQENTPCIDEYIACFGDMTLNKSSYDLKQTSCVFILECIGLQCKVCNTVKNYVDISIMH